MIVEFSNGDTHVVHMERFYGRNYLHFHPEWRVPSHYITEKGQPLPQQRSIAQPPRHQHNRAVDRAVQRSFHRSVDRAVRGIHGGPPINATAANDHTKAARDATDAVAAVAAADRDGIHMGDDQIQTAVDTIVNHLKCWRETKPSLTKLAAPKIGGKDAKAKLLPHFVALGKPNPNLKAMNASLKWTIIWAFHPKGLTLDPSKSLSEIIVKAPEELIWSATIQQTIYRCRGFHEFANEHWKGFEGKQVSKEVFQVAALVVFYCGDKWFKYLDLPKYLGSIVDEYDKNESLKKIMQGFRDDYQRQQANQNNHRVSKDIDIEDDDAEDSCPLGIESDAEEVAELKTEDAAELQRIRHDKADAHQEMNKVLKRQVDNLQREIENTKARAEMAENDSGTHQREVEILKERHAELKEQKDLIEAKLKGRAYDYKELINVHNAKAEKLRAQDEELEELRRKSNRLESATAETQAANDEKNRQLESAHRKLGQLEIDLATKNRQLESTQQTVGKLESDLAAEKGKNKLLGGYVADDYHRIRKLKKKCSRLQKESSQQQSELADLRRWSDDLNRENSELENTNKGLSGEARKKEERIRLLESESHDFEFNARIQAMELKTLGERSSHLEDMLESFKSHCNGFRRYAEFWQESAETNRMRVTVVARESHELRQQLGKERKNRKELEAKHEQTQTEMENLKASLKESIRKEKIQLDEYWHLMDVCQEKDSQLQQYSSLVVELGRKTAEGEVLQNQIQEFKQHRSALENRLQSAQNQSESVQSQLRASANENESLQQQLREFKEYCQDLGDQLVSTQTQLKSVQCDLHDSRDEAERLREQVHDLEQKLEESRSRLETELKTEKQKVDGLATSLKAEQEKRCRFETQAKVNKGKVAHFEKQSQSHKEKADGLETQLQASREACGGLTDQLQAQKEKVRRLEVQLGDSVKAQEVETSAKLALEASYEQKVVLLSAQINELQGLVACWKAESQEYRREMDDVAAKRQKTEAENTQLEQSLASEAAKRRKAEAEQSVLEQANASKELEISQQYVQLAQTKARCSQLEQSLSAEANKRQKLEEENVSKELKIAQQTTKISEQTTKISEQTTQIDQNNAELFELTQSLTSLDLVIRDMRERTQLQATCVAQQVSTIDSLEAQSNCQQKESVQPEQVRLLQEQLQRLQRDKAFLGKRSQRQDEEISVLKQEIGSLKKQVRNRSNATIKELQKQLEYTVKQLEDLKARIKADPNQTGSTKARTGITPLLLGRLMDFFSTKVSDEEKLEILHGSICNVLEKYCQTYGKKPTSNLSRIAAVARASNFFYDSALRYAQNLSEFRDDEVFQKIRKASSHKQCKVFYGPSTLPAAKFLRSILEDVFISLTNKLDGDKLNESIQVQDDCAQFVARLLSNVGVESVAVNQWVLAGRLFRGDKKVWFVVEEENGKECNVCCESRTRVFKFFEDHPKSCQTTHLCSFGFTPTGCNCMEIEHSAPGTQRMNKYHEYAHWGMRLDAEEASKLPPGDLDALTTLYVSFVRKMLQAARKCRLGEEYPVRI